MGHDDVAGDGAAVRGEGIDRERAAFAPGEAEVQVYVNRGKTYIELESQGAYTLLQPGESLSWTVRWYLLPVDKDLSRSELLQRVSGIND